MGLFEPQHVVLILLIALLIFGPGKLADLGGSLGRSVRDFKKAMEEPEPPRETPRAPAQVAAAADTPADALPQRQEKTVR